jgi:hypothetical protein
MPNGFIVINEKDWEKATPEQRDWFIYSTLQAMNSRLKALEKKPCSTKSARFSAASSAASPRHAASNYHQGAEL